MAWTGGPVDLRDVEHEEAQGSHLPASPAARLAQRLAGFDADLQQAAAAPDLRELLSAYLAEPVRRQAAQMAVPLAHRALEHSLERELIKFAVRWASSILAAMDQYRFTAVAVRGDGAWHRYVQRDAVFIVVAGRMSVEFAEGRFDADAGELMVVPQGMAHRMQARRGSQVLLAERHGFATVRVLHGDSPGLDFIRL